MVSAIVDFGARRKGFEVQPSLSRSIVNLVDSISRSYGVERPAPNPLKLKYMLLLRGSQISSESGSTIVLRIREKCKS